MSNKSIRIISFAIIFSSLVFTITNISYCSNTDQNFTFQYEIGNNSADYKLYLSIKESLYEYYKKQNHYPYSMENFSRFVTPNIFLPVAKSIKNLTDTFDNSDEAFANIVLDIVHQIPYNKTNVKFPIETLVNNYGDCDALSVLAASILKAGELDVVLFFYEDSIVNHMNVGIYLPNKKIKNESNSEIFSYEYEGKQYLVAETTGKGWKVGTQPENYINSKPKIIPVIEDSKFNIGEISSSLKSSLVTSNISLNMISKSYSFQDLGAKIQFSGSIFPQISNQDVIIITEHESKAISDLKQVKTNELGNYNISLNFDTLGKYSIQSTWNGYQNYSGSDSKKLIVNIGLNYILDQYETNKTVTVGSEYIITPTLDPVGNRILGNQPIKTILEEDFTEKDIIFSTEFTILGNNEKYLTEHNLTIPGFEERIIRNKRVFTHIVPEQTVTIENYRKRMHSNLEFIYLQNSTNTSTKIRLLEKNDLEEIVNKSNYTLIDASNFIKENTIYKMTTSLIDNEIIVKIFENNETILHRTKQIKPFNNSGIRIISGYEPDSIIIINKFEAEILEQNSQIFNDYEPLLPVRNYNTEEPKITETPEVPKPDDIEPSEPIQKEEIEFKPIIIFGALILSIILIFVFIYKKRI